MFFPPVCIASGLILRGLRMLDTALADLERTIRASGLKELDILQTAGMCPRYLYRLRRGQKPLTPRTMNRLRLAVDRLKRSERVDAAERETDGATPHKSSVAAQYRIALALVASVTGAQVAPVLDADPNRRATADAAWMKAAQTRRLALYIANQYLNVPQSALARAARMTKSAVSIAMKELEDLREQPDVHAVLELVEGAFQA